MYLIIGLVDLYYAAT